MAEDWTRRVFLTAASALAACAGVTARAAAGKPALLGGKPIRGQAFPSWPVIREHDEASWMEVLRAKHWYRRGGHHVADFENTWARTLGARHCLATNGGTTALYAALHALEIGPKDEVLVPPYTFIATVNVVLLQHALPVFVDSDPETFQIDAAKIEAAITPRTRCILPVHLGGSSADMDGILGLARKHDLSVLEDACQSHLAEWRGRKVGTLGDLGCFSFQASKNLNCGEGGAVVTDDARLMARAEAFHNNGSMLRESSISPAHKSHGCNLRMTEFQGALLLTQMERLETQSRTRQRNAAYLTAMLADVPGVAPARMYSGCTRNAYHLYMFRYDPAGFAGLSRATFLKALQAEGIPCSGGYGPLNRDPFLRNTLESRAFKSIYSGPDIASWHERNHCPANDELCMQAVWLGQSVLLGPKQDMEHIAEAITKIQKHAVMLKKA